jgi:Asp-tRNA(Asn)/Glu-tRNA(Gln) amidotransferase A subunit family amidase
LVAGLPATRGDQSKINSFCHIFFDKAEEQIKQGLPAGPLTGVPFALKDLGQYLRGTTTSAGSRVWKDSVADFDSTTVARYKQAGLVIFGKTTSPDLTTTTESVLYGKTRNPWNLKEQAEAHRADRRRLWPAAFCPRLTQAMAAVPSGSRLRVADCSA